VSKVSSPLESSRETSPKAGEIGGVALVMLALHAGPFRKERWCDDIAGISPLAQRTVEHVPRTARFVTGADPAYGFASRKSFTIGTMMGMRCINVT
jgi:hypothetical protein